ncbi:metal-dependent hydrolase [archaeon]|nr:metal-dependent hydrolase [archaeon]
MPFTLFHLGPLFLIGFLTLSLLYLPALVLGGTIVDIEPLISRLQCPTCPSHGFFHSFLGASIGGIFAALIVFALKKRVDKVMSLLKLEQPASFKKIMLSGLVGAWSHVFLDAPLDPRMQPFYPLPDNPFYGLYGVFECYAACAVLIVLSAIFYYYTFKK